MNAIRLKGVVPRRNLADIRTRLRLKPDRVYELERRGLERMAKHPELRAAWEAWKADGCPRPAQPDFGETMLGYQEEVARWIQRAEWLRAQGAVAEAEAMEREASRFGRLLSEAMGHANYE